MQSPNRTSSPFEFFNIELRRIDADPFVDTKSGTLISDDTSHAEDVDDALDFSDRFESVRLLAGGVCEDDDDALYFSERFESVRLLAGGGKDDNRAM